MPGWEPSSRLSTLGVVAPVTETVQPSQLMPANQKGAALLKGQSALNDSWASKGEPLA
jgi:hypothetical protein